MFQPGKSGNPNGKPKGAKSKKVATWDNFVDYCMSEGLVKFKTELSGLKGKQFTDAFTALLEFYKPKLTRTQHSGDQDNPIKIDANATLDLSKLSYDTLTELAAQFGAQSEARDGSKEVS